MRRLFTRFDDTFEDLAGRVPVREHVFGHAGIPDDPDQQVVEIVSDAAGEETEAFQFLGVPQLLLDALPSGDVEPQRHSAYNAAALIAQRDVMRPERAAGVFSFVAGRFAGQRAAVPLLRGLQCLLVEGFVERASFEVFPPLSEPGHEASFRHQEAQFPIHQVYRAIGQVAGDAAVQRLAPLHGIHQGVAFRQRPGQLDIAVAQHGKHVAELHQESHAPVQAFPAQPRHGFERREILRLVEAVFPGLRAEQFIIQRLVVEEELPRKEIAHVLAAHHQGVAMSHMWFLHLYSLHSPGGTPAESSVSLSMQLAHVSG